jgi:tetratricopeptide (TPR) repeat protein
VKNPVRTRWGRVALCVVVVSTLAGPVSAQTTNAPVPAIDIRISSVEGKVEVFRAGAQAWKPASSSQDLHVGDRVRTLENSRISLLFSNQSVARFGPLTEFAIDSPVAAGKQPGFSLSRGLIYFFHREKPASLQINTRTAAAAVEGTEFNLEAIDSDRTILTVLDGVVELRNDQGRITLTNGEQGIAEPGKVPARTAVIDAVNIIQWALYYPAILDLADLNLDQDERQAVEQSLAAYRSGDLLQALAEYPAGRTPRSAAEKIYLGALLLAVGQVEPSEKMFDSIGAGGGGGAPSEINADLVGALRKVVAAVKGRPRQPGRAPELATEWLAESYHQQLQADLSQALQAARRAVDKSPNFSFGWARVAELEFSFGHTGAAIEALDRSLELAPRNAEALALKGFLLAARNRIREAITYFERAMAIDGALGNAWLGRGLCLIRQGKADLGRKDLLMAAALEPQRALLRSYLGKAYADSGDQERALKELRIAQRLDRRDPTAWLYLALLEQQNNQINDAVRDLESSQELNENRRVYRSRLLLDQDQAVRSANLANVYRDAGMFDVSVREAGRAVASDYGNYSAHLFLANSYDSLRDPNRINLRYETPAESEYLIANLLAPVGAGPLAQSISQQEYTKLFERDRFGVVSSTEYLSRGAWTQNGAQFGTFENSSYAVEGSYRTDPGQRPNNDFEEREFSVRLKQQLSPKDSVYAQAVDYHAAGGDVIQYYDQSQANPGLRTKEKQEPILSLGYHREWSPGVHTLVLASRLSDHISVGNPTQYTFLVDRTPDGLDYVEPMSINEFYDSSLEIYSAEAQQSWQTPRQSAIFGVRFQTGDFHTRDLQTDPSANVLGFVSPVNQQDLTTRFERLSLYGYYHWRIAEPLLLIGGASYDRITAPQNFRAAPISNRAETRDQGSPKAGLIWTPYEDTTVRAAYTRSLAGASIDQSLQLEPSQVAGFNQSFRSIIPESEGGAQTGAHFETYGVSLEQRFKTGTYLGFSGQILNSKVERTFGVFEVNFVDWADLGGTQERLRYRERAFVFTADQLIDVEWSAGLRYQLTTANLGDQFPEVLPNLPDGSLIPPFRPSQRLSATLHQLNLHLNYNGQSGIFAELQALWNSQSNKGYEPVIRGDDYWQFDILAGYRFPRRHADLAIGVLNLTDQDYRLNPLTLYNERGRDRTFVARFRFAF